MYIGELFLWYKVCVQNLRYLDKASGGRERERESLVCKTWLGVLWQVENSGPPERFWTWWGSLSRNILCACVYIYIWQLSSFRASMDLTVATCHIQYTFLSYYVRFFHKKTDKTWKYENGQRQLLGERKERASFSTRNYWFVLWIFLGLTRMWLS